MARGRGANAKMALAFESSYGTPPGADYFQMPFVQSQLGAEQGLIESDLLGLGRAPADPVYDVVTNDGDVVVPLDTKYLWLWLKGLLGAPTSQTGAAAALGSLTFTEQPDVDSTIAVAGTTYTFKASGATGNQINIGADIAATVTATVTKLNAASGGVAAATYAVHGSNTSILTVTHDTPGAAGNALTLAASPEAHVTLSGATLSGGTTAHLFASGSASLPSSSIEIGNPDVPSFSTNYGCCANTIQIQMQRSGLANATVSMICKGETAPDSSTNAGTPTDLGAIERFAAATGSVLDNGVAIGEVVSATLSFSNALDKDEVIRPDGEIGGADPSMPTASLALVLKFSTTTYHQRATAGTPMPIELRWTRPDGQSLKIELPRVFLPRTKKPIQGPGGIQVTINGQASAGGGQPLLKATLTNMKASY